MYVATLVGFCWRLGKWGRLVYLGHCTRSVQIRACETYCRIVSSFHGVNNVFNVRLPLHQNLKSRSRVYFAVIAFSGAQKVSS